jgi:MinD-like ATPase involved in chromosome partitioning or flagellar assembly
MNTAAVTIAGPDRRVDLVVPTETPIDELVPTFLDLSADDGNGRADVWTVSAPGTGPLPLDRTLAECGVSDGAVLTLTPVRSQAQAPPRPAVTGRPGPSRLSPRERVRAALPEELGGAGRLSHAVKAFFDHGDEPPVLESAEPRPQHHRELLTRPEQRSAMQRAREAWREADYIGRLDRAIAAPRQLRCVTIAVVSPKGGVGKTTLTALLGSILARARRERVVAVDSNPDFGSLGRTLVPDHPYFVDDVGDVLEQPDLSVTALDRHLGRAMDGLLVLPAPTEPARMARLDETAYRRVIERLQDKVGIVVLDCGTGLHDPAARAALAAADQILLVSDAHPSTASLVTEAAQELGGAGAPITLAVNRMPKGGKEARLDLDAMERLLPDAAGLLTVQQDEAGAALVAGGDFSWDTAPPSWARQVRELAVAMQSAWPELGLAL